MPLYDYECPKHGVFEEFASTCSKSLIKCPRCGKISRKLISACRINVANEDAFHIRQSAEALLDKETAHLSEKPHVRALAEKPTRSNLKAYMKAEGIRYAENEKGAPPVYKKPPPVDEKRIADKVMQARQRDKRLEVRSA